MNRIICLRVLMVLLTFVFAFTQSADSRGAGGGRGGGGGGARMSAARSGASRSMPSNYGSMRTTSRPSTYSTQRSNIPDRNISQHQGDIRSYDTRLGGEVAVGVVAGGAIAVRGETAGGKDYAGVQGSGGDRVIAGQTPGGDIKARYRGDGDGVVDRLPGDYRTIYIDDDPYYYHNHHYYWPYYYGGVVYYQEVYPPDGTTTEELPADATTETINGIEYYLYDDVYYTKEGDYYVVSAPPEEAGQSNTNNISAADLMKAMCRHLGTYSNFVVESTEQVERPDKTMETIKRRILVRNPDRLAAAGREGSMISRFWYDGQSATTLDESKNVYSTIAAPSTISAMIDMLQDEYGTTIPLADLVNPGLCDSLESKLDTMTFIGREEISGQACNKLSLMTEDYSAQLWIDADEQAPVLRKVEIIYMTPNRRLKYTATINKLEVAETFDPELFVFHAPANAQKIEMLKRP